MTGPRPRQDVGRVRLDSFTPGLVRAVGRAERADAEAVREMVEQAARNAYDEALSNPALTVGQRAALVGASAVYARAVTALGWEVEASSLGVVMVAEADRWLEGFGLCAGVYGPLRHLALSGER